MGLGLNSSPLAGLPSLTLQPSLLLCRTPCRCTAQASTPNGSSASCATQCSRRYPVSGFYQMTPQWLPYARRWVGKTPLSGDCQSLFCSTHIPWELLPVFMSVTLSVPVVSELLLFPWLSLRVSLRWGAFLGNWWDWGEKCPCGSRIHAIGRDGARLTDRDRQGYYQCSVLSSYPQCQGILRLGSKGWSDFCVAVVLTLFPQLSWLESASILLSQPSNAAAIGKFPAPSRLLIIGLSHLSVQQRGLRHARQS